MGLLAATDATPVLFGLLFITVLLFGLAVAFLSQRLKRCPNNKLLVVFGQGVPGGMHVQHGGARLVWPLLQDYAYMSLEPFTAEFPDSGLFTREAARVTLNGEVSLAIGARPDLMQAAAERLLGLDDRAIVAIGKDETAATIRELVANLTVEMIFRDREKFSAELHHMLESRLAKFGLEVLSVRAGDITDSAGIIDGFERDTAQRVGARAREDREIQERRRREEAALAERHARQREEHEARKPKPVAGAGPGTDVLKEDPGDALKNM